MATIPATCKAAVLTGYGEPIAVGEVQVPDDLEHHALLVRISVATICGSDVHIWDGQTRIVKEFPTILGHEMVGEIVRMGEDADRDSVGQPLEVGDRIVWSHGQCGSCYYCVVEKAPNLCLNLRGYMMEGCRRYPYLVGGFAEYCYVFPTSGRIKVPADLSDEIASASSCALRTVVGAFDRLGQIDERHTVVVQGAGPVGLFSVAKAIAAGPAQVLVIGGPDRRVELAAEWGAIPVSIDAVPDPAQRLQIVMEATGGLGADIVVEGSGAVDAFDEGIAMLRPGGRYLVVGQSHTKEVPFNPGLITRNQLTLIGSRSAGIDSYFRALEFLRQHADRFTWDKMLSTRYPLDDITDALESMRTWQEIKPVITTR
jgi:L-iditol 2-dehydrogenase